MQSKTHNLKLNNIHYNNRELNRESEREGESGIFLLSVLFFLSAIYNAKSYFMFMVGNYTFTNI